MAALIWIFWIGLAAVWYTYAGYGMLAWLIIRIRGPYTRPLHVADGEDFLPGICLIVPCYNEAGDILRKVADCKGLSYPKDKLRLIFIADGSSDGTEQLLAGIEDIEVLYQPQREGKAAAMNRAMQHASEPVVVFSDANTRIHPHSLLRIARHYRNPQIGGVACEKRILRSEAETASSAGEGIYWQYESFLKTCDAGLKTIIGAAGELMSVRSDLYRPIPVDTILDDFVLSMDVVSQGYIVAYEPGAYAEELASANIAEELKRKIRISAGSWQAMLRLAHLLNPLRDFWVSFIFWSHRVMRWSVGPFFLFALIPVNALLWNAGPFYRLAACVQILFYSLVLLGKALQHRRLRSQWIFVPYYFFIMNYAVAAGFLRFLSGKQSVQWEKSVRTTQSP